MDISRAVLDNLMGRDRNKPKDKITERDHYSNPDVCKPFLVCFCFNTLFPNTTYDEGPCQKRHDTYLKTMFQNDPERAPYQRQYIKQCIHWIERRLQDVDKKSKQNQAVIDNKSNFPTDRPKAVLDRIYAIDQDIQRLINQSQKYGQQGLIEESSRCLEEVQKLRQRRREIQSLGPDMTNALKQQKICVVCGAIQTINDTEKRIQTHLEGKIHQGFLKLRHQIEALKIRLEVLNKMHPEKKSQKPIENRNEKAIANQSQFQKDEKKQKEKQRDRSRQRRERQKNHHQRQLNGKEPDRRERDRSRDRRQHRQHKQKKHHRQRDSRDREHRQRHHKESKEHKKKHKKHRSRSRSRQNRVD